MGLAELTAATGLNKATILRLLGTLCEVGLVYKSPATGLYRLGYEFLTFAEVAKRPVDMLVQARPLMRKVRDALDETVFVAVQAGDYRVNIEQLEGLRSVRRVVQIGTPSPLYLSASSKVFLAAMEQDELEAYLARTKFERLSETTIVDPDKLRQEARQIRRKGYAEAYNEGNTDGAAISSPIRGESGDTVGAFSVTVPVSRFTKALRTRMIDEVVAAAATISQGLGYKEARAA